VITPGLYVWRDDDGVLRADVREAVTDDRPGTLRLVLVGRYGDCRVLAMDVGEWEKFRDAVADLPKMYPHGAR